MLPHSTPRVTVFVCLILPVFCAVHAQITGKVVKKETQEAIVGANVLIVNTNMGTTTDDKGVFSFDWQGDFPIKIRVSHIGYIEQEVTVLVPNEIWMRMESSVLKGKEILITGERRKIEREVSSSGEDVSLKQIEVRGIRDIGEALQEMTSVIISTATSGRQTASVRGSNANEISVYLDGIKLNRALDGVADLSAIDMMNLSSVEIIRGGNSVFFGPGNFGGVIHLSSQSPESNTITLYRNVGLADARDQDLSGAINLRARSFGLGGRFSGKSRLYDGRTLYTSLFNNLVSTLDLSDGKVSARHLSLGNSIKFPTGSIIAKDSLSVNRASFHGSILGTRDWDIQYGFRVWAWQDSFFDNITRDLDEETTMFRIGKSFHWNRWDGTIQWEMEDQWYFGDNLTTPKDIKQSWGDNARLRWLDKGWAGVLRYTTLIDTPTMESIRFELGVRPSRAKYNHRQTITEFDSLYNQASDSWNQSFIQETSYEKESKMGMSTFRLGAYLRGTAPRFRYNLFFNQGWNKRPPTLNDYFLWFTTRYQADAILHGISPEEKTILFQGILTDDLFVEHLSTTEVGGELIWEQMTTATIDRWVVSGSVFRNHYIDKIAYRLIGDFLPIPYNTPIASVNGIEIGTKIKFLEIFHGSLEFTGNVTLVGVSNKEAFPNKPSAIGRFILDWRKGVFHLNLSHIYEGPQVYQRGGVEIRQYDNRKNTNLTLTLTESIWLFDVSVSYSIRNLFSNQITFVDFAHYSNDPFHYYEAHRTLFSLKLTLSNNKEEE
ncbi:MAG: TonB-dependent receptor [Candidatus Marinimicrobia bacterium]|jgi:outer membrane receptor protein involved in Fe transport|nr:TonB-dependent receptor [Candidatus Neomarinimicrobiota bacterium]|tara:strand:+ start:180 stop:2501 length:2322 start_codon:yes stop_codon:yes gene_type:complete